MLSRFRGSPAVKFFSSLRLTVVCIALLFILTAWGTLYQVQFGLYAAQRRFFYSWVFTWLGFLPFPGGQLVLWSLFLNLLTSGLFRYAYVWKKAGILLIHWGLVLMLVGAFTTYYFAQESVLALQEGEASNVSSDYHDWELSAWLESGDGSRSVAAADAPFEKGRSLSFSPLKVRLQVEKYFVNALPLGKPAPGGDPMNASGITQLEFRKPSHDPVENLPGGLFSLDLPSGHDPRKIILFGGEEGPLRLPWGEGSLCLQLRKKRHPLPFTLQLVDFKKEEHPGTEIAKNFESTVEIRTPESTRDVRIYMNNPLRYQDFTFYQSSYSIGPGGRETSVFAVVKNVGRIFPYLSSGVAFAGLLLHFLTVLFSRLSRGEGEKKKADT